MKHKALTGEAIDLIADRFKALSEPARLRILNTLRAGELSVSELVDELDSSHANVSKHLQQLYKAGFVKRRKQGLNVYYALSDRSVFRLCDIMCGRIDDELKRHRVAVRPGRRSA